MNLDKNIKSDNLDNSDNSDNSNNLDNSNKSYENLEKLIEEFWNYQIYNSNTNHIYNEKIINIIENISKLKKKINSNKIFNITSNLELEINDTKEIQKHINNFKKENSIYLKTHGDCFPDFFVLIGKNINHLKKVNSSSIKYLNNDIYSDVYILENIVYKPENLDIFNDNNIKKEIDIFISNILDDNIYHKKEVQLKLEENFNNIKNKLISIEEIFKSQNFDKILILDMENLLKSSKVHYLLKKHINDYDILFKTWFYGYFSIENDFDNITKVSLSEFSNCTKYIEPYSSISLDFIDKNRLAEILVKSYFKDYFVIYTLNIKNKGNSNIDLNVNINKNFLSIPIIYDKNDIREQDDHIMIFLYSLLLKKYNTYIVSSDKFKWYKNIEKISIKNIKLLYDFDNLKNIILIDNFYTNDLIKFKNNFYNVPFYNFPIIDEKILIKNKEKVFFKINIKEINLDHINFIFYNLFKVFCEYLNDISNEIKQSNKNIYTNFIEKNIKKVDYLQDILEYCIKILIHLNEKIKPLYNFLDNHSKKEIFNMLIETTSNSIPINSIIFFDRNFMEKISILLEKIKLSINIYILFKSFTIYYLNKDYCIKLSKLFSLIIYNYDQIEKHTYKIRKLSNDNTEFNKIFLELNSIFIYIKKIGLCKKNF